MCRWSRSRSGWSPCSSALPSWTRLSYPLTSRNLRSVCSLVLSVCPDAVYMTPSRTTHIDSGWRRLPK